MLSYLIQDVRNYIEMSVRQVSAQSDVTCISSSVLAKCMVAHTVNSKEYYWGLTAIIYHHNLDTDFYY